MAGAGTSPPGLNVDRVHQLQRVTRTALEQVREIEDLFLDLRGLLVKAGAGEPGALVLVTAAADTLRCTADRLEGLTRRKNSEQAVADLAHDLAASTSDPTQVLRLVERLELLAQVLRVHTTRRLAAGGNGNPTPTPTL